MIFKIEVGILHYFQLMHIHMHWQFYDQERKAITFEHTVLQMGWSVYIECRENFKGYSKLTQTSTHFDSLLVMQIWSYQ